MRWMTAAAVRSGGFLALPSASASPLGCDGAGAPGWGWRQRAPKRQRPSKKKRQAGDGAGSATAAPAGSSDSPVAAMGVGCCCRARPAQAVPTGVSPGGTETRPRCDVPGELGLRPDLKNTPRVGKPLHDAVPQPETYTCVPAPSPNNLPARPLPQPKHRTRAAPPLLGLSRAFRERLREPGTASS